MFDVGGGELILVVLAVLLLFGPKKLPEIAQMVGKGMQQVRKAQAQFQEQINEIKTELDDVGTDHERNLRNATPVRRDQESVESEDIDKIEDSDEIQDSDEIDDVDKIKDSDKSSLAGQEKNKSDLPEVTADKGQAGKQNAEVDPGEMKIKDMKIDERQSGAAISEQPVDDLHPNDDFSQVVEPNKKSPQRSGS